MKPCLAAPRVYRAGALFLGALAVLSLPGPVPAYIDMPAEQLTLPRVMLEFRSIGVCEIDRVDVEKGAVRFKLVERVQGPVESQAKHAIKLNDAVPAELKSLKVGQRCVLFTGDGYGRGLTFVNGAWYCSVVDSNTSWWNIAYTDAYYDFKCAFAGTVPELTDAIKTLLKGEDAFVRCRKKSQKAETQLVSCSLRQRDRKLVLAKPPEKTATVDPTAKLALPQLIEKLTDKNVNVRVHAADGLARHGKNAKSAVPALSKALQEDKDPFVRRSASVALGEIGPDAKAAVPALVALVQSQYENVDGLVGSEASYALSLIDPDGAASIAVVAPLLKNDDASVRMDAAGKLATLGATVKKATPALIEALKDKEGGVRYAVTNALGSIGADAKTAVPALIPALKDPNEHVRRAAARALGNFGKDAKAAVPALTAAQKDPNAEVRQYADEALKRIQAQ
jgi:HEAT repeat protein